jgi:hypothetical protein
VHRVLVQLDSSRAENRLQIIVRLESAICSQQAAERNIQSVLDAAGAHPRTSLGHLACEAISRPRINNLGLDIPRASSVVELTSKLMHLRNVHDDTRRVNRGEAVVAIRLLGWFMQRAGHSLTTLRQPLLHTSIENAHICRTEVAKHVCGPRDGENTVRTLVIANNLVILLHVEPFDVAQEDIEAWERVRQTSVVYVRLGDLVRTEVDSVRRDSVLLEKLLIKASKIARIKHLEFLARGE